FTSSGFGETAYTAQSVANSAADQAYGQVVYQFASSGAASTFFSGVQSLSARCHSFTARGGGSDPISMQLTSAASVAGQQTFWLDQLFFFSSRRRHTRWAASPPSFTCR